MNARSCYIVESLRTVDGLRTRFNILRLVINSILIKSQEFMYNLLRGIGMLAAAEAVRR